jgi:hypothetical protein
MGSPLIPVMPEVRALLCPSLPPGLREQYYIMDKGCTGMPAGAVGSHADVQVSLPERCCRAG